MSKRLWKGRSKFYREFMINIIKTIFRVIILILVLIGAVRGFISLP